MKPENPYTHFLGTLWTGLQSIFTRMGAYIHSPDFLFLKQIKDTAVSNISFEKVGIMSRDPWLTMLWMRVCVYHDTEVSVLVSCSWREQRGVVQQLRQQFSRFVKMFFISTESALFVHTQQGVHLTLVTCRDPKRWAAERTGNYTGSRKERKQPRTHRAEAGFSSTELWPLVWHSARCVCHNSTSPIPVDKHKHFLIKIY